MSKCTITWKNFNGDINSVTGDEPTLDAAIAVAEEAARLAGWTPRRWWMWWRWDEHLSREAAQMQYRAMAAFVLGAITATVVFSFSLWMVTK